MRLGTKTYSCSLCHDEHTVDVTAHDLKQGYIEHYCERSERHLNTIYLEQDERPEPVATGHNNLPDDMQESTRGMF